MVVPCLCLISFNLLVLIIWGAKPYGLMYSMNDPLPPTLLTVHTTRNHRIYLTFATLHHCHTTGWPKCLHLNPAFSHFRYYQPLASDVIFYVEHCAVVRRVVFMKINLKFWKCLVFSWRQIPEFFEWLVKKDWEWYSGNVTFQ